MSFVHVGSSAQVDQRVDQLLSDSTLTREDIQQLVMWLQYLEERVDAIKTYDDAVLKIQVDGLWKSLDDVAAQFDTLYKYVGSLPKPEKTDLSIIEDRIKFLQRTVDAVKIAPPKQNISVSHQHEYVPPSNTWLWIAFGSLVVWELVKGLM
jgi:hypothetical protein